MLNFFNQIFKPIKVRGENGEEGILEGNLEQFSIPPEEIMKIKISEILDTVKQIKLNL